MKHTKVKNTKEYLEKHTIGQVDGGTKVFFTDDTRTASVNCFEEYTAVLLTKLDGINYNMEITPQLQTRVAYDIKGKKFKWFYETKYNVAGVLITHKGFEMRIVEDSNNSVELYWLETYNKGNGLGSDLLDVILEVADETNTSVRVIPSNFDEKLNAEVGAWNYLHRLKLWYISFGFKTSQYSPVLKYTPKK